MLVTHGPSGYSASVVFSAFVSSVVIFGSLPTAGSNGIFPCAQLLVSVSGKRMIPKRIFAVYFVNMVLSALTAISHFVSAPTLLVIEHERSSVMSMFGGIAIAP